MANGRMEHYFARTTYDSIGRVHQKFDAGGDGSWRDQGIEHRYNEYGYLQEVVDAVEFNGAPRSRYYQVLEMDLRGNVTRSRQGNGITTQRTYEPATGRLRTQRADLFNGLFGDLQDQEYEWDELGNLLHRYDYSGDKSLSEDFDYDDLNRLKWSEVSDRERVNLDYDAWGNIRHKSDVGDYRYGDECQQGAGPHALCETSDGQRYWYDANGSMVGDSSGRRIEYSSFDKPTEISKDGHTTRFAYNPNRARYLRTDENAQGATTLTRYLGNVERITHPDGRQEIKRRLPGGALISYTRRAGGQPAGKTTHYLHKDHLGSIDTISDETGQLVAQMSFDPWGQRRNAMDWDALVAKELREFNPDITGITKRGFTGHEMLDEVGLIHMNGRIYDPRLGRFMQADPFIDGESFTQGYNRYSYVYNNPLNATDPTGHFVFSLAAIALTATNTVTGFWAVVGTFAAAGFGDAMVQGASVKQALKSGLISGVSAAAFYGIGEYFSGLEGANQAAALKKNLQFLDRTSAYMQASKVGLTTAQSLGKIAAHGLSGGVMSALGGGKFGHGFAAAGLTQAAGGQIGRIGGGSTATGPTLARIAAASVLGGSVSKLTGGKFANGAMTGAFSRAVSNELHIAQKGNENGRALTTNEIETAKKVYGDTIDYSKVRIISGKYIFLQGKNTMMAPNGNIYDPRGGECPDYTTCQVFSSSGDRLDSHGTFIHEMGHIAQHQAGVNVFWRGLGQQSLYRVSFGLYNPYSVTRGSPPPITNIEAFAEYNRRGYCSDTGECNGW